MSTNNTLLGALSSAVTVLAVLHNQGVKLGHIGTSDFIELAEDVFGNILGDLVPPQTTDTTTSTTSTSGAASPNVRLSSR